METCRTCAKCDFKNGNDWLDLFHPMRWAEEIAHIRTELMNWKLKVRQNDGLPQKICALCFSKFCDVYAFRVECQQAQIKLSNIFEKIEEQSMESEVDTLSGEGIERQCAQFVMASGEDEQVNSENTLIKIFKMNSHSLSNLESINRFNALEMTTQDQIVKSVSVSLAETATTAAMTTSPPPTPPSLSLSSTANNDTYSNQRVSVQQDFKEIQIQKDINSQYSDNDDEAHFNDLIEEVENDDDDGNDDGYDGNDGDNDDVDELEIETFPSISIENLIEVHDVIKADEPHCDFSINFECKYCYKSKESPKQCFASQRLLLAHITSEHNMERPYSCPHCQLGFRDAASRTVHIKEKHVEKHHECSVCGKKYADRCNLRHHVEKFHSENDFECNLCEKRFYSRKSLKYHMKWHDPQHQLKCNYCDRLFINQRHLQCHEATHTGLRNTEYCSFCGKSFIHLKTLRWHIFRKHGGEKPYKCSNCTEAVMPFSARKSAPTGMQHIFGTNSIHSKRKFLKKSVQEFGILVGGANFLAENGITASHTFTSYREKRIHMLEYHLENLTTLEKSECMLCHKHFDSEKDLKHHMIEGHKPKKAALIISNNKRVLQNKRRKSFNGIFQCEFCSQRFNMKTALERHMNVHSVEGRPHACPQCSKRFKRIQDLNWHMKTHSNDKVNICDVCGKGFALKYVLTQHKRSHEVLEKNFKCEICGRAYLFEKSLRVHKRVHTGKTYYKCDLCSESFVTHIKLKYHMGKKHRLTENIELPFDELVNIVIPGN